MTTGRRTATAVSGDADGSESMMIGHATASSEHDFLVTMVAHHREAIVAAGQLARSERPEMRCLGRHIIHTQAREVRQLRRWLDRWYWAAAVPGHYRPMMSDLTSLEGDDLDSRFLIDMVRHHMLAVMLSRQLLGSGMIRHRQVARLTESMAQEQSAEIDLMRRCLSEWQQP